MKVVIIGAGQLGSRHLQGIAQSSVDIDIEVVEPYEESRKIAEKRFLEIENRSAVKSIQFFDSSDKLSNELDLVIIATGANVRYKVITDLLSKKTVKNLILEKVLFQTVSEYYLTEDLLLKTGTKCWVNHPRRMFPIYHKLKNYLKNSNQISYNFQGGDWGLGCNALHFIDHLSFFADSTTLTVHNSALDKKIYPSKRDGFIEFNGLLTGSIDNHQFSLYSNKEYSPALFTITSERIVINIDEGNNLIEVFKKDNDWKKETIKEKIVYYQSELSQVIVENITNNEPLCLPTYNEAMELHIPFIQSLLEHMNSVNNKKNKICKIT